MSGIDLAERGAVEGKLAQIDRRDLRLGRRRWAQRLEIDHQHAVFLDHQTIDLP